MGLFDSIFGGGSKTKVKVPSFSENLAQIPQFDSAGNIATQARVNRVNQATPFGSLTFEGPERNQLRFSLSPELQQLFQTQAGFGAESGQLGQGLLSAIPQSGDAATNAILQRLQPGFDLADRRLRNRLEQSGNPAAMGTDYAPGAYNELALQNQTQNDARLAAVLAGPQYHGQLIQNAVTAGNASPIGVPQFNFQGATPLDVVNPTYGAYATRIGAAGNAQANATNAAIANAQRSATERSGILGGLFDLGSAFIGLNPFGWGGAAAVT